MNRFRNHLFLLFVFVLFNGCTAYQAINLVNSGRIIHDDHAQSTIPFALNEHPMLIKAKLNNSQKDHTFILDTGALTIIRQAVANELGLPAGIKVKAKGYQGNSNTIQLVKLDKISVGDMDAFDCAAGVIYDTEFSELFPRNIDGVLGSNFLRFFIVGIDYQKKEITLSQRGTSLKSQNHKYEMPFSLDMKKGFAPEINCIINDDIESTAIIDTGTPFSSLSLPILKKTESFKSGNVVKSTGSPTFGLAGRPEEDYALRIKKLKLGALQIHDIPALSHSAGEVVLIGNDILSKFLVTIDYPAKKILLAPNGEAFEKNRLGYTIGYKKHDNKIIVSRIWKNSSAEKSGIKIGDEIRKINGIEVTKLSMFELMEIFLDKQLDSIDIEFVNEHGIHQISLGKEYLLPVINE